MLIYANDGAKGNVLQVKSHEQMHQTFKICPDDGARSGISE